MQIAFKLRPLVITLLLFLIWKFTPLSRVPAKFIKAPGFVETFELFFFPLLLALSFFFQKRLVLLKVYKGILLSIFAGYIASAVSIFAVWIVSADKTSDVFYWLNYGSGDGYLLLLILPIPTLGWGVALMDYLLLKILPLRTVVKPV